MKKYIPAHKQDSLFAPTLRTIPIAYVRFNMTKFVKDMALGAYSMHEGSTSGNNIKQEK